MDNIWAGLLSQKLGYAVTPGEPYYTPGCVEPSQCVFPTPVFLKAPGRIQPRNLLQYIPLPNQSADTFSTSAQNEGLRDDKGAARVDANTRWGTLSAYYFLDDYFLNNPYPRPRAEPMSLGSMRCRQAGPSYSTLGLTTPLGSNTVNELHFSYLRDRQRCRPAVGRSWAESRVTRIR